MVNNTNSKTKTSKDNTLEINIWRKLTQRSKILKEFLNFHHLEIIAENFQNYNNKVKRLVQQIKQLSKGCIC